MDTVKTRLQSQHGFIKSGGFKSLYRGLLPVIAGSAPGGKFYPQHHLNYSKYLSLNIKFIQTASLFFMTYEGFKEVVQPKVDIKYQTFVHMGAAFCAEMVIDYFN